MYYYGTDATMHKQNISGFPRQVDLNLDGKNTQLSTYKTQAQAPMLWYLGSENIVCSQFFLCVYAKKILKRMHWRTHYLRR